MKDSNITMFDFIYVTSATKASFQSLQLEIGGSEFESGFHERTAVCAGLVKVKIERRSNVHFCGVEVWRRGYQLRCNPRHMTGT